MFCICCGNEMMGRSKKYCSISCQMSFQNSEKVRLWLDGKWNPQTYDIPTPIRRFLMEESGYRCSSPTCCIPGGWSGVNPRSGKTTLTIDHIDGNALNNTKENLRVLCPNCHSLTPTFGGLNKGNGRTTRYK